MFSITVCTNFVWDALDLKKRLYKIQSWKKLFSKKSIWNWTPYKNIQKVNILREIFLHLIIKIIYVKISTHCFSYIIYNDITILNFQVNVPFKSSHHWIPKYVFPFECKKIIRNFLICMENDRNFRPVKIRALREEISRCGKYAVSRAK